jgi:hypothetical protein
VRYRVAANENMHWMGLLTIAELKCCHISVAKSRARQAVGLSTTSMTAGWALRTTLDLSSTHVCV